MEPRRLIVAAVALVLAAMPVPRAQDGGRHLKLYVEHSDQDRLSVIDVATNTIIKEIRVGSRPHGLAVDQSQTRLYVSTEGDRGLTIVDTVRDVPIKRYTSLGRRPNEIDVTPDGRLVFVPAQDDYVYEIFDTVKEQVTARIPVDGFPHNVVVSPDGRYAYLAPENHMSPEELKAAGLRPSINRNIYIVDTRTQELTGTIPIPSPPHPLAVAPDGKRLFVTLGGFLGFGTLDIEKRKLVSQVAAQLTPEEQQRARERYGPYSVPTHGITVAAGGKEVWVMIPAIQAICVFDVTVDPPKQIARVNNIPAWWATTTPDGNTVYVAMPFINQLAAFDVREKVEKARIKFPEGARAYRMLVVNAPRSATSSGAGQ